MAASPDHGKLDQSAQGIHVPYQWSYANASARTGATGFVSTDVGKLARQTDNNTIWLLTATTPTWLLVGGGTNTGVNVVSDIVFIIDGGGSAITTGMKGYIPIDFACTVLQAELLADQSGSIVVDVFKCTYAQFDAGSTHPVSGDKITASAPPTITTATKAQDSTLTGWTTAISAGDILAFNVNSASTVTRVTVTLKVQRS